MAALILPPVDNPGRFLFFKRGVVLELQITRLKDESNLQQLQSLPKGKSGFTLACDDRKQTEVASRKERRCRSWRRREKNRAPAQGRQDDGARASRISAR